MGLGPLGGIVAFGVFIYTLYLMSRLGGRIGAPDDASPQNTWGWAWFLLTMFVGFLTSAITYLILR